MSHVKTTNGERFVVLSCILLAASIVDAAKHPRLVSLASTKCTTCHADLLRGFDVVHPPAEDDCSSCHDVSITEEGTTVALADSEPALCIMCHDHMEAAASGDLESPHAPVADSCINCHSPHASGQENLLLAPRTEICGQCHELDDVRKSHGGQVTPSVDCSSCHQAHGSKNHKMLRATTQHAPFADGGCDSCHREPFAGRIRLRARGEKICIACHGEMNDQAGEQGSTHPALTGTRSRAGCLSCHNPHMSDKKALLIEEGPSLCGSCHAGVTAAASENGGHAPAAEDCLNCHLPHASTQKALLVEAAPALCAMCHDVDDTDLRSAHLGADLGRLQCLSCHSPHGEGHPKLLARNLHAPVLDGCDTCHEDASDKLMEDGESPLCLACHDDIGEAAAKAAVNHPAMEMVRCADCHNPHASKQERLISLPGGQECTVCHEDQAATQTEVAHGVITLLGCRACHEPHGGANANMLRTTGDDLCLRCHDPRMLAIGDGDEDVTVLDRFTLPAATARRMASLRLSDDREHGHPVPGHRVRGEPTADELKRTTTNFSGTMACLSCHDPHKGQSAKIFRWNAQTTDQVCSQCHDR